MRCLHSNLARIQNAEWTNDRGYFQELSTFRYLFTMTCSIYLFIFHVQLPITALFDYRRVRWHGIEMRDTCLNVNWVSFYWNCPKSFAEKCSPVCCWNMKIFLITAAVCVSVMKTSAHLFTWMRNAAGKIFCDHLDKFIRNKNSSERTKYKTWHACIFKWLHQRAKNIHWVGAYCCCNWVSFPASCIY